MFLPGVTRSNVPITLSGRTFNRINDVLNKHRRNQLNLGSVQPSRKTIDYTGSQVPIYNSLSEEVPRFGILALTEILIQPTEDEGNEINNWAFTGATPDASSTKIGILPGGASIDEISLCVVSGFTPVQIDISDEGHEFAAPTDEIDRLVSSSSGFIRIFFKPAGTGLKWCIVLLPVGGTASLSIARITDHANSEPPFLYSGDKVSGTDEAFEFTAPEADLGFTLINTAELGPDGEKFAPIPNNTPVIYTPSGSFNYFTMAVSRGVYP